MPNWCDNSVFLTHDDPVMIQRAIDSFNDCRLMSEFHPCPKELTETMAGFCGAGTYAQELLEFKDKLNIKYFGYANWYDWNNANWGTKWDVGASCGGGDGHITRNNENSIILSFISAWSPPIEFYSKLVELGFNVSAKYYESGMGFCGSWEDGIDNFYNIPHKSQLVIDSIPEELDQEFCISESMAEWEYDDLISQINELEQKIEGEGCEETCHQLRQDLELLRDDLNKLELA